MLFPMVPGMSNLLKADLFEIPQLLQLWDVPLDQTGLGDSDPVRHGRHGDVELAVAVGVNLRVAQNGQRKQPCLTCVKQLHNPVDVLLAHTELGVVL